MSNKPNIKYTYIIHGALNTPLNNPILPRLPLGLSSQISKAKSYITNNLDINLNNNLDITTYPSQQAALHIITDAQIIALQHNNTPLTTLQALTLLSPTHTFSSNPAYLLSLLKQLRKFNLVTPQGTSVVVDSICASLSDFFNVNQSDAVAVARHAIAIAGDIYRE